MKYYVVTVFLLVALPVELQAVGVESCYSCNSAADSSCGDPSDGITPYSKASHKSPCGLKYCMKAKTTLSGTEVVARTCTALCVEAEVEDSNGKVVTKCCETKECNSGTNVGPSLLILLLPLIAIFVAKRV